MADELDSGEKTEPASPRKREEAREKGQVARSGDLNSAVLLVGATLILYLLANSFLAAVGGLMGDAWGGISDGVFTVDAVIAEGITGIGALLRLILPFLLGLLALALLINVCQVGFRVSTKPLEFDITKLSPIKGAKRILSRRGVMRLLFGLVKLAIVGVVVWTGYRAILLEPSEDNLVGLLHGSVENAWSYSVGELFSITIRAGIALLLLAILDLAFQRWQHEQDLKMTKQEVREEMKRMEGDPKLKERRRRVQQQLALQRMMHDVPTADVVITNPTHFACALKYDEKTMQTPKLLAKGQDHVAHRIRERAIEHGVPIVEEPPLARSIFSTTEVGEEIPPDLYQPVAEVLSYVYRAGEQSGARTAAGTGERVTA